MIRYRWIILIVLVGFLWIYPDSARGDPQMKVRCNSKLQNCYKRDIIVFLEDNFYGIINASLHGIKVLNENCDGGDPCLVFLQKNDTKQKRLWKKWPQVGNDGKLYIPKQFKSNNFSVYFLSQNCTKSIPDSKQTTRKDGALKTPSAQILGQNCTNSIPDFKEYVNDFCKGCFKKSREGSDAQICISKPVKPNLCKTSPYEKGNCINLTFNDKYLLDMNKSKCINCDNPRKSPDEKLPVGNINTTKFEEGNTDAAAAVELMGEMGNLVSVMNGTSASLSVGGAEGVLVRQSKDSDVEKVAFAYESSDEPMQIIEDDEVLASLSRSVTVSKEAFQKAGSANVTALFAAVLRFMNMTPDEYNRTTLGNEVIAVEMGTGIKNLTDKININFKNIKEEGNATCYSWNGEGGKPNWTDEGCKTIRGNTNDITCQCSHLTFFAILMTPLNETISSSDLSKLTIITQIGCGLSMFFLCIVLFMHFLIRKTKANISTKIFIHLVFAMFLLNFSFLINNSVANLKNSVGCKIMAAVMHYSMLVTFSWFAVQGLHLCLQLHSGGRIVIQRYVLKVSVPSWILPSAVVIALLAAGKYGEQTIYTDNSDYNVAMCWITDNTVHYVVNVGYYMLVFLFTFTMVIVTVSWLFCLRRTSAANKQTNQSGRSIVVILGLCCLLGITWGFAFFAYGPMQLPAYYIFTILNSFQGFFLFIYYYNTRQSVEINAGVNAKSSMSSSSSTSTLKTNVENYENPYLSSDKSK